MRCIWQMDGDKVKGFKCDFSPVDMLMIISGLKYIVADIERHPKDRERAQGIYNQIMLCRYHDEADRKTEPSVSEIPTSSEKPNNCEHITEDGVTCAKYPACDDCLDNPLNKVKGSERLLKGKDEPQNYCDDCLYCDTCDSKEFFWACTVKAVKAKDEPQTDGYISGEDFMKIFDEPQTDCAWK